MKKLLRVLCLLLCLCLLPLSGNAVGLPSIPIAEILLHAGIATGKISNETTPSLQEWVSFMQRITVYGAVDETHFGLGAKSFYKTDVYPDPVTRSEFELSVQLHADAFPTEGVTAHLSDWESFLKKLSVKGTVDSQNFLQPANAVLLKGSICLNGKEEFPFTYDRTNYYRYFSSPLLGKKAIHWNMGDFYEFCYKGYYYYEFPMLTAGLLLFPESTTQMIEGFYRPVEKLLNRKTGTRVFSYEELLAVARKLQAFYENNPHDVYYYLTAMFEPVCMYEEVNAILADPVALLDRLDPEKKGMTITEEGGTQSYVLGDTQVFTRTEGEQGTAFMLNLPLSEELCAQAEYEKTGGDLALRVCLASGDEERLSLSLTADGLPTEGVLSTQGSVEIAIGGTAITQTYRTELAPFKANFAYERSAETTPRTEKATIDFLHPETDKASFTLNYAANVSTQDPSVIVKTEYEATESIFGLNESVVDQLKETFAKPLVFAAVPFVLELPLNCLDDLLMFANDNGFVELIFKDVLP